MERSSGILDILYTTSQEVRQILDWEGVEEKQDCPHYGPELEISLVIAWMDTTECLLEDLGVELVNSRPSLFNSALREGSNEGKPFSQQNILQSHKFDNG